MFQKRIAIIPAIHGKLDRDGKLCEPDIFAIMEKWYERHPDARSVERGIRILTGRKSLPGGVRTELIRVSMAYNDEFADYDPAQDEDLYSPFIADPVDE